MIKKVEVYIVECDGDECNEVLDETGGDFASTSYETEAKATYGAVTSGWTIAEKKYLCPECSDTESKQNNLAQGLRTLEEMER